MKFFLPIFVSCLVASAWATPTTRKLAGLDVHVLTNGSNNATWEAEMDRVFKIEMGKSLRSLGKQIKNWTGEISDTGDDVSPYGMRDFFSRMNGSLTKYFVERAKRIKESFSNATEQVRSEMKTVLKEAVEKALTAAVDHIQGRIRDIVKGVFAEFAGSYAVDDNMSPLRNMYAALGDELEKLGQDIEFRGV